MNIWLSYIKSHKALSRCLFFLSNILIFTLLAWLLPIRFETSDDIAMAQLANGIYDKTANGDLIFQSIFYGKFLNILYTSFPKYEWYTLFECLFQILSATIIISFLRKKIERQKFRIIAVIIYYSIWTLFIARLQFTSTTAMLAFASCLLLVDKKFISGGVLLIISSLLRFEAAGMVGLFMIPTFIYEYKLKIKQYYLPLGIILALICIIHIFDYSKKNDLGSESIEHNVLRSKIQDSPSAWRGTKCLPPNISEDDYKTFYQDFVYDTSVFSNDALLKIIENIQSIPLKYKVKDSINTFIKPNFAVLLLVILSFLLYCIKIPNAVDKIYLSSSLALWLIILFAISLRMYVKVYVLFSSLLPIIFCFFYPLMTSWKSISNKTLENLIVSILLLYPVVFSSEITKTITHHSKSEFEVQREMLDNTSGRVLALSFDSCEINPFRLRHNTILNRSFPFAFLSSYHHNNSTYKKLVDEKILIFASVHSKIAENVCNSLHYHNNIKAEEKIIYSTDKYKLFVLKKLDDDNEIK